MSIPKNPPASQKYIVHMAHAEAWEEAQRTGSYTSDTLQTAGFIHLSRPEQLLGVANSPNNPFLKMTDLVLLYVDPTKLQAELRYEIPEGEQEDYPHLYGALHTDAVVKSVLFTRQANGLYSLPLDLAE
jgi:uncharacterized protein (DUF952 family)